MPAPGTPEISPYIIRYNQRPRLPGLVPVPTRAGAHVGRVKVWNADQPGGSVAPVAGYTGGGCPIFATGAQLPDWVASRTAKGNGYPSEGRPWGYLYGFLNFLRKYKRFYVPNVPHRGLWGGFSCVGGGGKYKRPGASGGIGAYLHPERGPRAGARGVAWRLLSRVKGAVFCGYSA